MSTRTAALPIERRYLVRAWLVVVAVVIAASIVAVALAASRGDPAGSQLRTDTTGRIADYGPVTSQHGPIVLDDGTVCGQCR